MPVLHQYEKLALKSLLKGSSSPADIAKCAGITDDAASKALYWLAEKKLVSIKESASSELSLLPEALAYLQRGFPEERVRQKAERHSPMSALDDEEKRIGVPWAKRNGWIEIKEGKLALTDKGRHGSTNSLVEACRAIMENRKPGKGELATLLQRSLASEKERKSISAELTAEGRKEAEALPREIEEEINLLTKEMLISGGWKDKKLRPYDISASAEEHVPGKRHTLGRLITRVRGIFSEMGFEEMEGPLVESSFWNFDALFQPQDHPARDLADTFYVNGEAQLPDEGLVKKVKKAHQKGWKYKWSEKEARKLVLRTHTTAVSARYLATKCADRQPRKFFCVGRVYRNEATDYKHLAEFHQVEGIVVWEHATFRDLLGCLKEFYSKMGFKKIRFRPSFFPYTEPSLEVEVFFEERQQWMELGGAGILRPEVSIPLCGKYPVLAWGLSLERPLMLLKDIKDIRTFYRNDVGWLRKSTLG
jgi:phenylalanyl-tRNA synthetase alpha chain